jgi:hypothetical protein
MSFVSSLVGGILGSNASDQAASVESQAAKQAQTLEAQNQTNAINSQNTATSTNQANEAPYQALGSTSAAALQKQLETGFTAPTLAEAEQNPGYQFALNSGTTALDKSAAARGDVFTGTQGTALQQYGQQLGEQNYQQVYNNALNNYMTKYQTLMGGTNVGQNAVSEEGQLGQQGAQNLGYVDLQGAQQQAEQINNAAAARASGYLGTAKAWGTAAGGMAAGLNPGNLDMTGGSTLMENAGNLFG